MVSLQLVFAATISIFYMLLMLVVLFGLVVEAVDTGLCSVTSLAMLILSVMIFITALLHPMVSLLCYCKNIIIRHVFVKRKQHKQTSLSIRISIKAMLNLWHVAQKKEATIIKIFKFWNLNFICWHFKHEIVWKKYEFTVWLILLLINHVPFGVEFIFQNFSKNVMSLL